VVIELIIGAVVCGAGGAVGTLFVVRHKVTAANEACELAAIDLEEARQLRTIAARAAAATEQLAHGAGRDLHEVRRWSGHLDQVHAEQVSYHRYLVGYHDHLKAWEAELRPLAEPAPVTSVAELRQTFASITGGGGIEGLPILGAPVHDLLGRSTVTYTPQHVGLLSEGEPSHHPGALVGDLRAVLDLVEETGEVTYDELVEALVEATGEQPTIGTDETADDPDVEPQGPAPTVPDPATETGYIRDWIGQAIRPRPVPSPLVIGRSVRELMRQAEEQRIDSLVATVEIPAVLVGAR
jgi:hypothetical protein